MEPLSRIEAELKGTPIYLGVPCYKGHNEGRFTSDGKCVICRRAYDRSAKRRSRKGKGTL